MCGSTPLKLFSTSQNQKYGAPPDENDAVTLSISHNELAQMAAMSHPHVSVTMNKLREKGFVDYARNLTLPVNVAKLRSHLTGY